MKVFMSVLLLFVLGSNLAKSSTGDSLRRMLESSKNDTSRIWILRNMATSYTSSRPDSALIVIQQALRLSRRIKFSKGEINCLSTLGSVFEITGNYPRALGTYLECLKQAEAAGDMQNMLACYTNTGTVYSDMGDERKALSSNLKARSLAFKLHDQNLFLVATLNSGDSYDILNQLDSARYYTYQGYELAVARHSQANTDLALCNLGNIHTGMKQPEIAIGYYRLSLPGLTRENNLQTIAEVRLGMAIAFQQQGKTDSALHYARLSEATAGKDGFLKESLKASTFLAAFFARAENTDSTLHYLKAVMVTKDSLFSQEKNRTLQNLSFNEEIRQQEILLGAAEASEARRKNIQMAAIGVFIPLFLGFILVYSKRKVRPKTMEFLGVIGLLLLFEFIALFLHPYIEEITHHTPLLMMVILVLVASLLVPLHHKLEGWMKNSLAAPYTGAGVPVVTGTVAAIRKTSKKAH